MNGDVARSVFDAMPWGLVVVDGQSEVVFANRTAREDLGVVAPDGDAEPRKRLLASMPLDPTYPVDSLIRAAIDESSSGFVIARSARQRERQRPDAMCVHAFPLEGDGPGRAIVLLEPLPSDESRERAVRALARTIRSIGDTRHAINNALMRIYGYAELLIEHREMPDALRDRARTILEDARRVHLLIDATKSLGENEGGSDDG